MKVLQINSVSGFGSTGRIATDIADILISQGDECMITYGRGDAPEKYRNISVKVCSSLDNKIHGALTRAFDVHGFCSNNATKKLIKLIKQYSPDVIHLHNIHGYYLNVEMLFDYLKRADIPVVWTLHDCWSMTGHCAYFSAIECDKYLTECRNCPQLRGYPSTLFPYNVSRNHARKRKAFSGVKSLTVITPSAWLADLTRDTFLGQYPIITIYNGIDLNVFKPKHSDFKKRMGIEDKKMILGVANIWEKRKGLDDFVDLSKLLDDSYKIVLVGLSEEQVSEMPENVIALTRTKSVEELTEIYSAADVYINPSIEETMGLTTAEALACGTPVITYNKTAVPEVCDDTCGIVVEPGVDNILTALEKVRFSADDCIKRAKHFEKTHQYMKYIEVYKNVTKQK